MYSSNQGDIDRRHLWEVDAAGGAPAELTTGAGIECSPAPLAGGAWRFCAPTRGFRCAPPSAWEARFTIWTPAAIPPDFPAARMVAPQPVVFAARRRPAHPRPTISAAHRARQPAPAVVFFHGGPRRQMLLGWHYMYYYSNAYALNQYLANAGYVVLSVNFRSGIGYGLDFREAPGYGASGAQRLQRRAGGGRVPAIARRRGPLAHRRWGGSYGGFLTAMALARDSDAFRAGVISTAFTIGPRSCAFPPPSPTTSWPSIRRPWRS